MTPVFSVGLSPRDLLLSVLAATSEPLNHKLTYEDGMRNEIMSYYGMVCMMRVGMYKNIDIFFWSLRLDCQPSPCCFN